MTLYACIFVMALTTYLIRVLPMTLFRKPIRSRFVKSFLHYVPYACLTAMTFPAILGSTASVTSGVAALTVGVVLALCSQPLIVVSLGASGAVLATEWILSILM